MRTEGKAIDTLDEAMVSGSGQLVGEGGGSLFVNSASWTGARAVTGFVRVGVFLAIARAYGPGSLGQVSLALSTVEILRTFSEFGIDTVSIRKFAQTAPDKRGELLQTVVGSKLALAACFYCVGLGVLAVIADKKTEILLGAIASLSLFLVGAFGAFSSYLQSRFSMSRVLSATLWGSAASVVFSSFAIWARWPLALVIAALPLADGLNVAFIWRRLGVRVRARFSLSDTVRLLRESLPVGLMAVLIVMYLRLDSFFVYKFSGEAALGLYAACFRMVEPALMVPHSFAMTAYSVLSSPTRGDDSPGEVAEILFRTMWPAYAFISIASLLLVLYGRLALGLFGSSYAAALPALQILAAVLIVRTANITLTSILYSHGRYSTLARITASNLAVNIVLVMLFVPNFGIRGAACAVLLTEVWNLGAQLMAARGHLGNRCRGLSLESQNANSV